MRRVGRLDMPAMPPSIELVCPLVVRACGRVLGRRRMSGPYRVAAVLYFEAGWPGPLPLPVQAKREPPPGYTGAEGIYPSRADVQDWADNGKGHGNIALRLPDDVIGVDVDMYDGKQGR